MSIAWKSWPNLTILDKWPISKSCWGWNIFGVFQQPSELHPCKVRLKLAYIEKSHMADMIRHGNSQLKQVFSVSVPICTDPSTRCVQIGMDPLALANIHLHPNIHMLQYHRREIIKKTCSGWQRRYLLDAELTGFIVEIYKGVGDPSALQLRVKVTMLCEW